MIIILTVPPDPIELRAPDVSDVVFGTYIGLLLHPLLYPGHHWNRRIWTTALPSLQLFLSKQLPPLS